MSSPFHPIPPSLFNSPFQSFSALPCPNTSSIVICQSCQFHLVNAQKHNFCYNCGSPLKSMMVSPIKQTKKKERKKNAITSGILLSSPEILANVQKYLGSNNDNLIVTISTLLHLLFNLISPKFGGRISCKGNGTYLPYRMRHASFIELLNLLKESESDKNISDEFISRKILECLDYRNLSLKESFIDKHSHLFVNSIRRISKGKSDLGHIGIDATVFQETVGSVSTEFLVSYEKFVYGEKE